MSKLNRSQKAAHPASRTSTRSTTSRTAGFLGSRTPVLGKRQRTAQLLNHAILLLRGKVGPRGQANASLEQACRNIAAVMREVRRAVKQWLQVHWLPDGPRLDGMPFQRPQHQVPPSPGVGSLQGEAGQPARGTIARWFRHPADLRLAGKGFAVDF